MCEKINKQLSGYLKASYPLIYIQSSEEERVERIVGKICNAETKDGGRVCDLFAWEEGVGIRAGHEGLADDDRFEWDKIGAATGALSQFIPFIQVKSEEAVEAANKDAKTKWDRAAFLAKDLHYLFINPNPVLYRSLRIFARNAKMMGMSLIAIGPPSELPEELKHEFVVLDCDLPDKDDIRKSLRELGESLGAAGDAASAEAITSALESGDDIVDAAKGMTESEVVGSAALSLVQSGGLDREFITEQKVQAVKKSGSLEIWPAESICHVGGLDLLKEFLRITSKAFSKEAREFGLHAPKGVLVVGVPGTGKSLTAKAAASVFKRPLIRFDVGSVKGSLVGDTEKNMRNALKTIDAASPCVLFIDEIEKAFAGSNGSANDSGVTQGMFGTFLSWMQDHTSEVYVIATANSVDSIPPEFLRAGRLDEVFFSDLPGDNGREEIFGIHLEKVGRDSKNFSMAKIVEASKDYSGAEIEQVVQDALGHAFADGADDINDGYILDAIGRTKPLAQTRRAEIESMRKHGKQHFRMASSEERKSVKTVKKQARKIQTEKA